MRRAPDYGKFLGVTQASVPTQARLRVGRMMRPPPEMRGLRVAVLVGVVALVVYVLPGLLAPAAHWPLWDVRVYWWGADRPPRAGGRCTLRAGRSA